MKCYVLLLTIQAISLHAMPIFIHDTIVKTKTGRFLDLANRLDIQNIDVTYFPQQILTIKDRVPKIIPITSYPRTKKSSYLKYITFQHPDNSKREVELLIKKEPIGNAMKQLLTTCEQNKLSLYKDQVIRIYRKINGSGNQWTPILTVPEQKAVANLSIHSDGSLHLE